MPARWLTPATFATRRGTTVRATYEHPALIRATHWLTTIALFVMAGSGLQILRAFPAFGPKVPEHDIVSIPRALGLGGWLAGGLRWHFTFMWVFAGAAALYIVAQVTTGRYRMVLFRPRDIRGVWPMVRHYFLFGAKPPLTEPYNPLQKLAYSATLACGAVSLLTGVVLYKPVQLSALAFLFGGYHLARIWHFAAMCGLIAFVPGHVLMVAIHGWNNFAAMVTGWNRRPEYLPGEVATLVAHVPAPAGSPFVLQPPGLAERRQGHASTAAGQRTPPARNERSTEADGAQNEQPASASQDPAVTRAEPGVVVRGSPVTTEEASATEIQVAPQTPTAEGEGNGDR